MKIVTATDAERFLDITKTNLYTLQYNLLELGYRFNNSDGAIQIAGESDLRIVDELSVQVGRLPVLYHQWYNTFRSVDFTQALEQREVPNNDAVAGLGMNCPLVFLDLSSCLQLREEVLLSGVSIKNAEGRTLMPTGGSASNCMPKGIWTPDTSVDPVLYDEGAGPVTMANELQTAFKAGGFPFWDRLFQRKRFTSPIENTPTFEELRPILTRGLIFS